MSMTPGHFSSEIGRMRMEEMQQRAEHHRLVKQAKARKDREPDLEGVPPVGIFTSLYGKALSLFRPRVAARFADEAELSPAARQKRSLRGRGGGRLLAELQGYMPASRQDRRQFTHRERAIGRAIQATQTANSDNSIAVVVSEDPAGQETIAVVTASEAAGDPVHG